MNNKDTELYDRAYEQAIKTVEKENANESYATKVRLAHDKAMLVVKTQRN